MLFKERPLLERPAAARAAGFDAIEIQFPYETSLDEFAHAVSRAGVSVALINFPAGDSAKGDRGLGALPDRISEFRAGIDRARRYAERLGVKRINLLAGVPGHARERNGIRETLLANMRVAARAVADLGATVCVEAINTRDVPGFYVCDPDQAVELCAEAGEPNLALQYDLYHMQIMRGDLIPTLERLKQKIGHIQFADTPGRHEPGTGEINFPIVFAALDRIGYGGWTSAEYKPSRATEDTLGWLAPWRTRATAPEMPA